MGWWELDDRAQDSWEPLLAIAELVGSGWPHRARQAALALSTGEEREDDSLTAQLLRDVHSVFEAHGHNRFRTADLLDQLCAIEESPWAGYYGKPLTAHGLSRLLRPHRIKTMAVKVDGETVRGYKAEQFTDAFARVLSVTSVTGVTRQPITQARGNASNAGNANHTNGTPRAGDDDFLDFIASVHLAGHITTGEALKCEKTHRLILRAGAA